MLKAFKKQKANTEHKDLKKFILKGMRKFLKVKLNKNNEDQQL